MGQKSKFRQKNKGLGNKIEEPALDGQRHCRDQVPAPGTLYETRRQAGQTVVPLPRPESPASDSIYSKCVAVT